ncbi:MAG TPA: type II secretion system protein [Gemmatimonadaceae bacterium]|nr:type II secretion system protein [Gemmatimonadaceae bacterium]
MAHSPRSSRRGATLVEIVAVLAVLAITTGVALPRAGRALDSIAVHSAIDAVAAACALARSAAVMRGTLAYVTVDSAARHVRVTIGRDTLLDRPLDDSHGRFSIRANRPTIAYGPMGMGFGAANTTVIARQGSAADTLVTSRLGRVRK